MGYDRLMPPRKKDWMPGVPQIGVFIRTEDGSTIECVMNQASLKQKEAAIQLITTKALPKDFEGPVLALGYHRGQDLVYAALKAHNEHALLLSEDRKDLKGLVDKVRDLEVDFFTNMNDALDHV